MKSNAYICVFIVGVLLVTSAFATDTSQDEKKSNDVKDANKEEEALETNQYYGGRRCRYGCCGRFGHFGCTRCCRPVELGDAEPNQVTAEDAEGGGYGYGYGGNGGGYRYGWSGGGYHGGGWGGRGGGGGSWGRGHGGCRYGCCAHNRYGGCSYCCHTAQEAKDYAAENEAQP
ncbi:PREDICTED: cold and drought-regulated protein CORA-like [Ipomoea nil]|uniref:cold and drought-regulated protein CORA-like n=1 Tax=Ipomoea nil TaxID=35883 RepID=UPI0009015BD7|nr:PREDICTED: cold and drought-regulated protein CORA-like [Ipomoea nil]